jgi:Cytochrome c7 and related cytochrome c
VRVRPLPLYGSGTFLAKAEQPVEIETEIGLSGRWPLARRLLTTILLVGLIITSLVVVSRLRSYPLPGSDQGYQPEQPIAFSHRQHAGDMQIACLYCHSGAESSPHAGIPAASVCMTCHRFVTAPQKAMLAELFEARKARRTPQPVISPELQKLYDALALDSKLEPDPNKKAKAIAWVQVHNLPAFTCFDHRSHVHAGLTCQRCHGAVETMERVRQVEDLSMGWCVKCHRESRVSTAGKALDVQPSTDCATCHH